MKTFYKKLGVVIGSVFGLASVASADTILPASVATDFADGKTDILTMVGLVFGVITTIYIFRLVRRMFN